MLNKEVVEAIRNQQFHIYPVKTVDEAAELLTGLASDQFTKLVDDRLEEHAQRLREFHSNDSR